MDGSRRRSSFVGTPWAAAFIAFALVVGCAGERPAGDGGALAARRTPAFSHRRHLEEDLDCTECHRTAETADKAGMPAIKSCMKCHDGIDEKKSPERRVSAFLKDGKPAFSDATAPPVQAKFSHKAHAAAKVQCASCHRGILRSTAVSAGLRSTLRGCFDCHDKVEGRGR